MVPPMVVAAPERVTVFVFGLVGKGRQRNKLEGIGHAGPLMCPHELPSRLKGCATGFFRECRPDAELWDDLYITPIAHQTGTPARCSTPAATPIATFRLA